MGNAFLAIGECMVEMAPAEGGLYRMGFAGDTFDTAWYARRLLPDDWSVGYLSAVGDDPSSTAMLDFMAAEGIETAPVRRIEGGTCGLYMIRTENGERSFSYWRGQSAARQLAGDPAWLDTHFAGKRALYFSGITLAILTPEARHNLCAAISRARQGGALVAFDTNLRPRLWESREAMREGLLSGASVADIVLPSFDEEQALWGDLLPGETISRYREAGADIIAVKNGAKPVHLFDGSEYEIAGPQPGKVVDSTAAGDSFGAAFCSALLQGQSAEHAATAGMALAAKVIGAPGALVRDIFGGETA